MHSLIQSGLEDYLAGSSDREFHAHLLQCETCRVEVEGMLHVSGLLSELRSEAPVAPPLGFAQRLTRNLQVQKKQNFWNLFSIEAGLTRKIAFASLLSLAILGSYLATQPDDAMAAFDHTPEAVIATHNATSDDTQQHLGSMLVTLANYHQ